MLHPPTADQLHLSRLHDLDEHISHIFLRPRHLLVELLEKACLRPGETLAGVGRELIHHVQQDVSHLTLVVLIHRIYPAGVRVRVPHEIDVNFVEIRRVS